MESMTALLTGANRMPPTPPRPSTADYDKLGETPTAQEAVEPANHARTMHRTTTSG